LPLGSPEPWLVAGLGNPGPEYAWTRHNVGALVTARLGERLGGSFRKARFVPLFVAEAKHADTPLLLTSPGTWMNVSGPGIASVAARRHVPVERVIAVHDEIDLPFGALRVKKGGSTAGHHGLDSMVEAFRSPDFYRVRIGVGRPARREQNVGHVLNAFSKRDLEEVDVLIEDAADAVLSLIDEGLEATQSRFNRGGVAT
jgi:peptidyl-tRNA hydrolase, PTH1 family